MPKSKTVNVAMFEVCGDKKDQRLYPTLTRLLDDEMLSLAEKLEAMTEGNCFVSEDNGRYFLGVRNAQLPQMETLLPFTEPIYKMLEGDIEWDYFPPAPTVVATL